MSCSIEGCNKVANAIAKKIRGLLCHHCNRALGSFGDSVSVLNKASSYLQEGA